MSAFFDLLQSGIDPKRGEGEKTEISKKVSGIMTAFLRRPESELKQANEKISTLVAHASTAKGDIPNILTDMAQVFRIVRNFDTAWEQAYTEALVDQGKDYWEIADMTNGIQFRKIPEAGRLLVEGISGSLALARVEKFGAALGWTDEAIRFRRINILQQQAQAAQDSYAQDRADRHYLLLAGAILGGGVNTTTYQAAGSPALSERERDVKTINSAAFALANRLKDQHVGNPLGQEMILYANPILWDRIIAALRQTSQDVPGAPNRVLYNIRYIPTFNSYLNSTTGESTNTTALLVLPGFKNQKATVMEPTSYFRFDHLTLGFTEAIWSYYGAIAEASAAQTQVQAVEFA
jgi:hypothetical protein